MRVVRIVMKPYKILDVAVSDTQLMDLATILEGSNDVQKFMVGHGESQSQWGCGEYAKWSEELSSYSVEF